MIPELVGGLLLFGFASVAIAEWFALQKLNQVIDTLMDDHERTLDAFYDYLWQE